MGWIEPKTSWKAEDYFNVDPDWKRITGNIEELAKLAKAVCKNIPLVNMTKQDIYGHPFKEVLQAVEDNTEKLRLGVPLGNCLEGKRVIEENAPVWNFEDLNRLEKNAFEMHKTILRCKANRPVLAFVMGGGAFAQGI